MIAPFWTSSTIGIVETAEYASTWDHLGMDEPDSRPDKVEAGGRLDREPERLAELRKRLEDATSRVEKLKRQIVSGRLNAAEQAERTANQADAFAAHLEASAEGQAREHRLRIASREREVAALERRNAARLREAGAGPLHLERPPSLRDDAEAPEEG